MLHSGLVRLIAVFCLLVQVWGGVGLDRVRVCIRPGEHLPEGSCASGCCEKRAPSTSPSLRAGAESGCCIQATFPDQPTLVEAQRDDDLVAFVVAALPDALEAEATSGPSEADSRPPEWRGPRRAECLASTRLRL